MVAHQYKIKSNEASKGYETPDDKEEDKEQKSLGTCQSLIACHPISSTYMDS